MRNWQHWILPTIVVVVAGMVLGWMYWVPVPSMETWPRCDYFRCVECDGPTSVDLNQPERWGCQMCAYSTFAIADHFRAAIREDFPDQTRYWDAMVRAGAIDLHGKSGRTMAAIWGEAGGLPDWNNNR
jgi:hypothetical protein